jgi:hypothetical protein
MRKTHWEQLQKNKLLQLYLDFVSDAVKITDNIHDHESDFRHIDCVMNHVKSILSEERKRHLVPGCNEMISPLRSFLFYHLFRQNGARPYKLAKDFAEQLESTKLSVPARVIPADNKVICVEFPDEYEFSCVYMACIDGPGTDSFGPVYKRIEFQFNRPIGMSDSYERVVLHFYQEDESIEDAVAQVSKRSPDFIGRVISLETLKYALNAFLYIHSGQPDLRQYAPPKRPLTQKPKQQRLFDKMMENQHGVPVTLVGFNFKKETDVGAHMQRYWTGTGRTTLMWIYKSSYTKGGESKK